MSAESTSATVSPAGRPLRILILAQGRLDSEKTWSGIPANMVQHLEQDVIVVEAKLLSSVVQGLDRHLHTFILKITTFFGLPKVRFHLQDHTIVARAIGCLVERAAKQNRVDLILGLSCMNYVAFVPGSLPVLLVTGSTFSAISQTPGYLDYAHCPNFMIKQYTQTEITAARRVNRFIVPAASGLNDLHQAAKIALEKIQIVPYGPNLDEEGARGMRNRGRSNARCDLLFLGGDWTRKGGDIAAETTQLLTLAGVEAHLHIVGPQSIPKLECPHTFYGRLSKSKDKDLIFKLLSTSFLLFVPSKSELFGVVFREAACFGLPSLAYDVGGVAEAVRNDVSGKLLSPSALSEDFKIEVERLWLDVDAYETLRNTTAKFYDDYCSWFRWKGDMLHLVQEAIFDRLKKGRII